RTGDSKILSMVQTHNAKRLAPRVEQLQRQIVRNGLAAERVAQSSKETKNVDGPLDFAGAFGEGLALLARQQFGQLGLSRLEEVRRLAEDSTARDRRRRGPGGVSLARRFNRRARLLFPARRIGCDDLACVGRVEARNCLAGS